MEKIDKKRLRHVSKAAFETFGKHNQMRQLQEECAELIAAINHHFRDRDPNLEETTEEMADVLIVINQLIIGLGIYEQIAHHTNTKLQKLEKKLNDTWQLTK